MRVSLSPEHEVRLTRALQRAGSNETGGQLFGEMLESDWFAVREVTFQARPGTFARFVVDLVQAAKDAQRYFGRTNRQYRRFNYLGEWHSHPSFMVEPSRTDRETMRELVADKQFKGTFALLMIAKLSGTELQRRAWLFDPRGKEFEVELEVNDV